MTLRDERVAVVGLGYVGLPVAVAFSEAGVPCVGFDIDTTRCEELRRSIDRTGEVDGERLGASGLEVTSRVEDLSDVSVFIVTVPTPVDAEKRPDFSPLRAACGSVGAALTEGALVVFESTVHPGATRELCVPWLEEASGLRHLEGFSVGYSPERINPGDKVHRLSTITKVVSGDTPESADRVAALYRRIVHAGVHIAPSIEVAEAAKVIENTQRDLNIALMNELSLIFDRLGIRTQDVLAAAGTKWNFLPFSPGLVGGHCIGVDPYYLTARAQQVGYHPEIILAGRRINDGMGAHVASKAIQLALKAGHDPRGARFAILGLTFKENVPDLRNSRVPDVVRELEAFGVRPLVHDPLADAALARREHGIDLVPFDSLSPVDVLIWAVPHSNYSADGILDLLSENGVIVDVKSSMEPSTLPDSVAYWSL